MIIVDSLHKMLLMVRVRFKQIKARFASEYIQVRSASSETTHLVRSISDVNNNFFMQPTL
jgi:hypothetical protein